MAVNANGMDVYDVMFEHDDDLAETALAVAKLCDVAATVKLGPGGAYEAGIAAARPLERFEEVMRVQRRAARDHRAHGLA